GPILSSHVEGGARADRDSTSRSEQQWGKAVRNLPSVIICGRPTPARPDEKIDEKIDEEIDDMPPLRSRRPTLAAAAGLLLAGTLASGPARAGTAALSGAPAPGCATAGPGGDWPVYGADPYNTRSQPAETAISAADASHLTPKWVFSGAAHGGAGAVNSTPVEMDGCVFVGTSAGWVYAIDAATGALVWKRQVPAANPGAGGAIVGSPAVRAGVVYLLVNETSDGSAADGPYVAALDESSGALRWRTPSIATYKGDYTNASPVVMPVPAGGAGEAVVFAGFSPPEGDPKGQGGFALVNATSGVVVATTYTVPPADQAKGFAGGGIWSTPAYDPDAGFAYVGTGNPYSKTEEDPNTNAILKIDLHPGHLGAIAGSYKGNPDQYTRTLQALASSPACTASESAPTPADDPVCGQLDLDFGASANLFTGTGGRLLVGDLQKAGVYHAADAGSMKGVWATLVGGPCHLCNAASTAIDAHGHVLGVSAPGGLAFALDRTGAQMWADAVGDGSHYQSVSTADGVVYTLDNAGFLDAFDAANGALLLRRPLAEDTGQPMAAVSSSGVSVARHLVLVAAPGGAAAGAATITAPPSGLPPSTADTFVIAYGP
ncbi:MAG TPA: PQQ-binding-like beta-propeller repeat protein, partial [Acidimicrobiales bacterium]|nr:PQQ-binding-like beta-propeller repeat protein [Acidimicrobiales bacterium]